MLKEEILTDFCEEEVLDEPRKCDNCNIKSFVIKMTKFYKLPFILLLHLKRFKVNNSRQIVKISDK